LTWLTRSIGVTLIIAILVYMLKERLVRGAVVCGVVVACLAGPWTIYASRHAPTPEQRAQQSSYIVGTIGEVFWYRQPANPYAGEITIKELPARVSDNVMTIVAHDIGVMVLAPLPYWEKGGEQTAEGVNSSQTARILSLLLSALAIAGFMAVVLTKVTLSEILMAFSLIVIAAFPWTPFRYLLPLLPFVLFYILMGIRSGRAAYKRWQRVRSPQPRWVASGVVVGCFVALNIYANAKYISRKYSDVQTERPEWLRAFEEHEALFRWIRDNIPLDEHTFITQNPPLLYLYTGQKTLPAADAALRRDVWKRHRVRYLAQMGLPRPPDPNEAEARFPTPYRSHGALNLRVVDLREAPLP
jgi:hypothetical protein